MFSKQCIGLALWGLLTLAQPSPGADPSPLPVAVLVEKENIVEAQRRGVPWSVATIGLPLAESEKVRTGELSRAAVRFTDLSMLRLDELTTIDILPPVAPSRPQTLQQERGGSYFFSREKALEIQIRTPAANGALRGTEFELRVAPSGKTRLTMIDGEVELSNAQGRVLLKSGEQGEAEIGRAPHKTAVIEATNIIQWCLYYPAVLDPAGFDFSEKREAALARSLTAYREGDLLAALAQLPPPNQAESTRARLFRAAVVLSVGRVDQVRAALSGLPETNPDRLALEQMIAAVKLEPWTRARPAQTSSAWLAESYYQQSRGNLAAARAAAEKATELSPQFGSAWTRLAELNFSFGRISPAMKLLKRGLELAPRNAQAHALQGFFLSAENRLGAAQRSFDQAITLDGALGDAWLGRGLALIRTGHAQDGRQELQTAAVLEPNRSLLRSYLGKAFSQVNLKAKVHAELTRAEELDPHDPTPWLYSAIQKKQENRYNEAIEDLEKSVALNDNRRLYRSQFLLDQDRAVRGTNLAAIYLDDGMVEQSVREAVRAVDRDYGSAPAHLFLANSYNALSDPTGVNLRYEAGTFNELLLSNLLSPVGGGPLSQFVSEQEYSKLLERDGLGASTITEYRSNGDVRETASQYGTFGNLSYALDGEYLYRDGSRPNNHISQLNSYATFKLQLTPQDTLFFQTQFGDQQNGNIFQYYDPHDASTSETEVPDDNGLPKKVRVPNVPGLTFHAHEKEDPGLILVGLHHEWSPGNHTLLLLGRLDDEQEVTAREASVALLQRDDSLLAPLPLQYQLGAYNPVRDAEVFRQLRALTGQGRVTDIAGATFDLFYHSKFETYSAELQQIITLGPDTLILGGRYQNGQFDTQARLTNFNKNLDPLGAGLFQNAPSQNESIDFERISLYLYNTWRVMPWLSLTGGLTYDSLHYPDNFRDPPLNDRQIGQERVSPKAGLILQPWWGSALRASYTEALGGTSFDESVRLEPTQVSGFLQNYRGLIPESILGATAGSKYKLAGLSFEQKLPTRTYLGVEFNVLEQNLDRDIGVIDDLTGFAGIKLGRLPSTLSERDHYREDVITATVNQLVGQSWAFGVRYQYTHSKFRQNSSAFERSLGMTFFDPVAASDLASNAAKEAEANLHTLSLYALYNHPSGFFARVEANWYLQDNDNTVTSAVLSPPDELGLSRARLHTQDLGLAGDEFWQFNVLGGYRFYRNLCEISCGVLNLAGQDYRLNPLNPYNDLPRERTFVMRCKLTF